MTKQSPQSITRLLVAWSNGDRAAPSDLIRDPWTTPFNVGRRMELHDFTEAEAAPLAQGLGCEAPLAATLLNRILYWTGGHPYLTQRLCESPATENPRSAIYPIYPIYPIYRQQLVDRLCHQLFLTQAARERDDNLLFIRERLLRSDVDLAGLLTLYADGQELVALRRHTDSIIHNQFNIVLPVGITLGNHTVVISRNGVVSNPVTIAIR
jgi:hypothetical protein